MRLAMAVLPVSVACATARMPVSPTPPVPESRVAWPAATYDTTWYMTNRARQKGELVRVLADSLEYGFMVSRFREADTPGPAGHLDENVDPSEVDSVRMTRDEFITQLRAADAVAARHGTGTIVYVHGYAVSFPRAVRQGSEIAHRGRHAGPFVIFAWPAHGSVAAWPSTSGRTPSVLEKACRARRSPCRSSPGSLKALEPGSARTSGCSVMR